MNRWQDIRALLILVLCMFIAACSYTDPFGGKWEVGPPRGAPEQNPDCEPTQVGEIDGWQLWDWDCDGTPDWAYKDGEWRRVTPAGPPSGNPSTEETEQEQQIIFSMGGLGPQVFHEIDQDHGFPFSFDFQGQTAAWWLAETGLNVDPETEIELQGFALLFNTDTLETEFTYPWSSAFETPDPVLFDLNYGFDCVIDEGPAFCVIKVVGGIVDVANYMLEMDIDGYTSLETTDPDAGVTWTVVADANAGVVQLYMEGAFVQELPLE